MMNKVEHDLEPVFDEKSKILILGTMPSVKSREYGFYYMHPQNRFWSVLENLFQEKIEDKKEFCLKHHIALWDTLKSCSINGSSDSSISNIEVNDLSLILNKTNIKAIITTGKKAHEIYQKYLYPKYKIEDICLPSTSPANATRSKEQLISDYQIIKTILEREE